MNVSVIIFLFGKVKFNLKKLISCSKHKGHNTIFHIYVYLFVGCEMITRNMAPNSYKEQLLLSNLSVHGKYRRSFPFSHLHSKN